MSPEPDTGTSRGPDPAVVLSDLDDAHHAIAYMAGWINNADTKAGLLSAVALLLIGALVQDAGDISALVGSLDWDRESLDWGRALPVSLLALSTIFLLSGGSRLVTSIVPNLKGGDVESRFGFPTLAGNPPPFSSSRTDAVNEAWTQARVLAEIVERKFARIRSATPQIYLAVLLYAAWKLAVAL